MPENMGDSSSTSVESTPTRRPNGARNAHVAGGNSQGNPSLLSLLRSVLLVLSTALVCFAAARNSITWWVLLICERNTWHKINFNVFRRFEWTLKLFNVEYFEYKFFSIKVYQFDLGVTFQGRVGFFVE